MLQTYAATLRDDRIEWGPDGPPKLAPNEAVQVYVTVLPRPVPTSNGQKLFEIMEAFAARGGQTSFPTDPDELVEWQREQRKDRPLPGRDE